MSSFLTTHQRTNYHLLCLEHVMIMIVLFCTAPLNRLKSGFSCYGAIEIIVAAAAAAAATTTVFRLVNIAKV